MSSGYQVIARRWRPRQFSDLVGQEHIVRTLKNAIERDRIAHAYLFVGPRGTGKTTTARLLAKALNCEGGPSIAPDNDSKICQAIMAGSCMDVIEIDGASNNSVDQIRNLREDCQYTPAQCRYKIYIIDEVHMLTAAAFNALLKTLEEPPAHVKFIFATTEAHKVLPTIVSRCQRFEFHPIDEATIVAKLAPISQAENIAVETAALEAIARMANGGMRDAQSILDQMIAFCGDRVTARDVLDVYGLTEPERIHDLARAIATADYGELLAGVETLVAEGRDLYRALVDLQAELRTALVAAIREQGTAEHFGVPLTIESLMRILDVLHAGESAVQRGLTERIHFETALFRAIEAGRTRAIDSVIKQLTTLTTGLPQEAGKKKIALRSKDKQARVATVEKKPGPVAAESKPSGPLISEPESTVTDAEAVSSPSDCKATQPESTETKRLIAQIPASVRTLLDEQLRGRFVGIYPIDPKRLV